MLELEIKTGYVYLLKNNILGGYKIGITTAPSSRFKSLSVGSKATLIGYWRLDAYRELEKHLIKNTQGFGFRRASGSTSLTKMSVWLFKR